MGDERMDGGALGVYVEREGRPPYRAVLPAVGRLGGGTACAMALYGAVVTCSVLGCLACLVRHYAAHNLMSHSTIK